jgi:ankyrin repeat protein
VLSAAAARNGSSRVVELLLDRGAEVNARDKVSIPIYPPDLTMPTYHYNPQQNYSISYDEAISVGS